MITMEPIPSLCVNYAKAPEKTSVHVVLVNPTTVTMEHSGRLLNAVEKSGVLKVKSLKSVLKARCMRAKHSKSACALCLYRVI